MEAEILQPIKHTFCDICGSDVNKGNGSSSRANRAGEDINLCHIPHTARGKKYDYKKDEQVDLIYKCEDLFYMLDALDLISVPKNRFS